MEQPNQQKNTSIQGLFYDGSSLRFWDSEYDLTAEKKGTLKFKGYPNQREIFEIIHKIDTQQRQFFAERFSDEILFGSQFIVKSNRENRQVFIEIFHNPTIIGSFNSTFLEISEFFLNGINTIKKTESKFVAKFTPELVEILGVGRTNKEDPFDLNRVYTEILENNKTNQIEEKLEKESYKEITTYILAKFILSEPVIIKSKDFQLGVLYLSYLLPKMLGFDFRASVSEQESESVDILIQKNIDNFNILFEKHEIVLKQHEIDLYIDIWNYFISHQMYFQKHIAARDRKALSESLIEKFSEGYSLKLPLEDLFTTPLGKKIGIKLLKNEIQKQSPDLPKQIELIFQRLSLQERKILTRELLDNRVIINYAIGQEIGNSIITQDWEIFNLLAKFSIPDYSVLQSAVADSFKKMNWDDKQIIDSANTLMVYILSIPSQNCREGWRIVGSTLYNELYSRGILSIDIDKKYSQKYKDLGIPTRTGKKGIFSVFYSPKLIPFIAFIALIEALIIIFLQNSFTWLLSDPWIFLNNNIPQIGDPAIILGVGIIIVLAIIIGISYIWFNERFNRIINVFRNFGHRRKF